MLGYALPDFKFVIVCFVMWQYFAISVCFNSVCFKHSLKRSVNFIAELYNKQYTDS